MFALGIRKGAVLLKVRSEGKYFEDLLRYSCTKISGRAVHFAGEVVKEIAFVHEKNFTLQ